MRDQELQGLDSLHAPVSFCIPEESLTAFDTKAKAWEEYTNTPLGRLRQELTLRHVVQSLSAHPPGLLVLDVGGGTGSYALPLAQLGHRVCILDFSAQMLSVARHKAEQLGSSVIERTSFCRASVQQIPELFAANHFDLILCHTVLEYLSEPWEVLRALTRVLRPAGLLSLLFANPYADPLRWALARGDLEQARLALGEQVSPADLFGLPRRTFTAQVVQEAAARAGIETETHYGVRIFADYLPAEKLRDPAFLARLLELEDAAGALFPYKLIARYHHLLGRKVNPG